MIDAVCDICGRQTAEPYEIKIHKLYDDEPVFVRVICDKCSEQIMKGIEYERKRQAIRKYEHKHALKY